MIVEQVTQGSDKWLAMRRGVITGSKADRLLTPAKQRTLAYELAAEICTHTVEDNFVTPAMQWGLDHEDEAAQLYTLDHPAEVVGFVWLNEDERIGYSPDLLGEGLAEIKCPSSKVHIDYVINGPPKNYMSQMQHGMWVCERAWCDFITYDPRVIGHEYKVHRVGRDDDYIQKLKDGAEAVLEMVDSILSKLENK